MRSSQTTLSGAHVVNAGERALSEHWSRSLQTTILNARVANAGELALFHRTWYGDIDHVYHFALQELLDTVKDLGMNDAEDSINTMIQGKRLRDIWDLPLDLIV